jgi:flagellar motor switch protein FliG
MAGNSLKTGMAQRPLKGPEKAAALLLAMGKPMASKLLKHFDAADLKEITRSAADLGAVSAPALDEAIEEFATQFSTGADLHGTVGEVEQLLTGVVPPEQLAEIMADILGSSNQSMWERLSGVPEVTLADYLTKEHPQLSALVLTKVSPSCAAKVFAVLPRDLRNSLMRRMVNLRTVPEPTTRILEKALHDELLVNVGRGSKTDTNARIAEIINKMEREQMEDVLGSLAEVRPNEAEALRGMLFSFEDIIKLNSKARMILFDKVPTERVVLALKGTEGEFRDIVLSSLASRARRMVESELTNSGPTSLREVTKARRLIADLVLEMVQSGEIELNSSAEDEQIVQ